MSACTSKPGRAGLLDWSVELLYVFTDSRLRFFYAIVEVGVHVTCGGPPRLIEAETEWAGQRVYPLTLASCIRRLLALGKSDGLRQDLDTRGCLVY